VRVDRCFGFVDLCGFTAFTERFGDTRAVLVLAELRTALREMAARRGVRVVKWLGDGAMLSSTMTDAVVALLIELDARMATLLPSLSIRAGVDAGPVIMFEGDDYIGRPVNVAARLCDLAEQHQVLASNAVMAQLPGWVQVDRTTDLAVKGFSSVLSAGYLSLCPPGEDAVVDPVCGLTLPREVAYSVGSTGDGTWFCSSACAGSWTLEDQAAVALGGPRARADGSADYAGKSPDDWSLRI
jgi:adenylate cyclase